MPYKDKEAERAAKRAYYRKNKDRIAKQKRDKYHANIEKSREQTRERFKRRDKETRLAYQREYYRKNKEKLREQIYDSRRKRNPAYGLESIIQRFEKGDIDIYEFDRLVSERVEASHDIGTKRSSGRGRKYPDESARQSKSSSRMRKGDKGAT